MSDNVYSSGRLDLVGEAVTAIHHGGGTLGNVQVLRLEEIVLPNGDPARLPFVSGNSVKHMIRDGAVRFALDAMGVADGSLSKAVVDLLFSGGHLGKGGATVDIGKARRLAEVFPALSLCGYSAGNWMQASRLVVSDLRLVCAENAWRLPMALADHLHATVRVGELLGEAFGTRHEASRDPRVRALLSPGEAFAEDVKRADALEADAPEKVRGSSQMLYEFEIVKAGSTWWGDVHFRDLAEGEIMALRSGLSQACYGGTAEDGYEFRVGAKGSIGYGRMRLRFAGSLRTPIRAPEFEASNLPVPVGPGHKTESLLAYAESLAGNRDEVLSLLAAIA